MGSPQVLSDAEVNRLTPDSVVSDAEVNKLTAPARVSHRRQPAPIPGTIGGPVTYVQPSGPSDPNVRPVGGIVSGALAGLAGSIPANPGVQPAKKTRQTPQPRASHHRQLDTPQNDPTLRMPLKERTMRARAEMEATSQGNLPVEVLGKPVGHMFEDYKGLTQIDQEQLGSKSHQQAVQKQIDEDPIGKVGDAIHTASEYATHKVGEALGHTGIGGLADVIPGGRDFATHVGETVASFINPVKIAETAAHPKDFVEGTEAAITHPFNHWLNQYSGAVSRATGGAIGAEGLKDEPVSFTDWFDSGVALVGTAMAVHGVAAKVRAGVIKGPQLAEAADAMRAKGVPEPEIQTALSSDNTGSTLNTPDAIAKASEARAALKQAHIDKNWQARTQADIDEITSLIGQKGGKGPAGTKLRQIRAGLQKSLESGTPHPAMVDQLGGEFDAKFGPGVPEPVKPPAPAPTTSEPPPAVETPPAEAPGATAEQGAAQTQTEPPKPAPEPAPVAGEQSPEEGFTRPTQAQVGALQKEMGWGDTTPTHRSWAEAAKEAMQMGYDRNAAGIAARELAKKRPELTDAETIGLGLRLKQIKAEFDAAHAAGDTAKMAALDAEGAPIADALNRSGSEAGRNLAAHNALLSDTYTRQTMGVKGRRAATKSGRTLTPEKEKALMDQGTAIEDQQAAIDAARAKKAQEQADQTLTVTLKPSVKRVLVSEETYQQALAKLTGSGLQSGFSPEQIAAAFQVIGYHIENGVRSAAGLLSKLKEHMPNADDAELTALVHDGVQAYARTANQGRGFGEDVLTEGKNAIGSSDIAALRKELDTLTKEVGKIRNTPNAGLVTQLRNQIKQLEGMAKKPMDLGEYKKLAEAIKETGRQLNQGRDVSPSMLKSGASGVDDPEIVSMREKLDQMKLKADNDIRDIETPLAKKVYTTITDFPRAVAIGGGVHGPALMVTHAGANIFRPSAFIPWARNTMRAWKIAASPRNTAMYDQIMQRMTGDPAPGALTYQEKIDLGLKVSRHAQEDFTGFAAPFKKFLGSGAKSADMLKVLRSEMFDQYWRKMSPEEQALPGRAGRLAKWVNEATGAGNIGSGWGADLADEFTFAARLESANWAKVVTGPAKMVLEAASKDPAARANAAFRLKQGGQLVGTYLTTLGVNWAINKAAGVKDEDNVNFAHLSRGDLAQFRVGQMTVGPVAREMKIIQFLANELTAGYKQATGTLGHEEPGMIETGTRYVRGKLSPFYGIATDAVMRADAIGRPMPWVSQEEKDKAAAKGKPAYTWDELAVSHAPIPIADGARAMYDGMRQSGVPQSTAEKITGMVLHTAIGMTGMRTGKGSTVTGPGPLTKLLQPLGMTHAMKQDTAGGEKLEDFKQRQSDFEAYAAPKVQEVLNSAEYKAEKSRTARKELIKGAIKEATADFNADTQDARDARKETKDKAHEAAIAKERASSE